ncbi:MAG: hypothetical protein ACREX8_07500 [Gammaproteobacteria bacterium]
MPSEDPTGPEGRADESCPKRSPLFDAQNEMDLLAEPPVLPR